MGVYIVQEGDNLSKIGKNLVGDTEFWRSDAFKAANPNLDVNRLSIGQKLEIPGYETPQAEGIPTPRPRPQAVELTPTGAAGGGSTGTTEYGAPLEMTPPQQEPVALDEVVEEAVPTYGDLTAEMQKRFGNIKSPHKTGNVQVTMPAPDGGGDFMSLDEFLGQVTADDGGGLLQRGVTRPTEEAGPDFSLASNPAQALPEDAGQEIDIGVNFANADPGEELILTPEQMARFQPEQADKVNAILRTFFREPNLIDDVLQSIGVTSPAAAEQ